jgi:hypothetical protein
MPEGYTPTIIKRDPRKKKIWDMKNRDYKGGFF